jgi:hypothetical protein
MSRAVGYISTRPLMVIARAYNRDNNAILIGFLLFLVRYRHLLDIFKIYFYIFSIITLLYFSYKASFISLIK